MRGICAFNVAIAHLYSFNFFNLKNYDFPRWLSVLDFAHAAVLMFFLLSGYVIGINHLDIPLSVKNLKTYLIKRLVRIYPIYLIALLLSIACLYPYLNKSELFGHFFFLQGILLKSYSSNVVLWSLSYEVIYYLIFPILWLIHNRIRNYMFSLLAFTILAQFITKDPTLNAIITGAVFWQAGLLISMLRSQQSPPEQPVISYFLLLLAITSLDTGRFIYDLIIKHLSTGEPQLAPNDLLFLPVCTLLFLSIIQQKIRFKNIIQWIAIIGPAFQIFLLYHFKHLENPKTGWLVGIVLFALSLATIAYKIDVRKFLKFEFAGKISYAVYLFHFPIAFYLSDMLSKYLSGFVLVFVGLTAWSCITLVSAFLTELKLQPRIKEYFLRKDSIAITSSITKQTT
ncbi:acyltransferase family protein [Pedobacter duraquae]|uniref:acyltransferase family protein n=1 Tax=Pedobacter duraquae TaxID=425511 RepID=UPI001FB7ADFD|nr:acyltransferase [Pedobacter duraquae]